MKVKEPIHIRRKKCANGNVSLYLDIYWNGRRSYEFLKLYLVPETNNNARLRNKETLRLAEAIKIQRIADMQKSAFGFPVKTRTKLIDYIKGCIEKRGEGTQKTYRNILVRAQEYFGDGFILEHITENDVKGFYSFVELSANRNTDGATLSKTTTHCYCGVFRGFLNKAAKDGLISYTVAKCGSFPKKAESTRQYLSIDEVQKLCETDIRKQYRKAFLFSCLTGLRKSDIQALIWGEILEEDGFSRILFRQKKTKNVEYLDISPQARQLLGERGQDSVLVFPRFRYTSYTNKQIREWAKSVGINKNLTFHCARHTFAVMMLTLGVDIYTTSKLLGHRELATTQIYAKIIDKKKQDAVSKIPIVIKTPPLLTGKKE